VNRQAARDSPPLRCRHIDRRGSERDIWVPCGIENLGTEHPRLYLGAPSRRQTGIDDFKLGGVNQYRDGERGSSETLPSARGARMT